MTKDDRRSLHPELGGLIQQPSLLTGIGFRPSAVSKGGFVMDIEAYQECDDA